MEIIVTGAAGFVGQALAAALLSNPQVSRLTLTDVVEPSLPPQHEASKVETRCIKADLTAREACQSLFTPSLSVVYLLHGLMSGASEANLDLGLKVNIDSMRLVLDLLRSVNPGVKVVFPSSCAVFGPSDSVVTETTMPLPGSSYGAQKHITEVLLNDYSRKGLLDGRILRLPTIIVRPGTPTGAASSFCSGIIREPLKGEKSVLPVAPDFEIWVCSTRTLIKNLIYAWQIPKEKFPSNSRIVNLPGITVTSAQMLDALKDVAGEETVRLVEEKRDPVIEKLVYSWPARFDTALAKSLGFSPDGTLQQILDEYIEDYGGGLKSRKA
ncbi:hypothetical protein MMC11_000323 [Xylographa trunciseda]|nr:hypothetical protein [Xylographa trunciseda]